MPRTPVKVGLLGGSGKVGAVYQELLRHHPLFELACSPSSKQSTVDGIEQMRRAHCRLLFSALPNSAAQEIDRSYAQAGFPLFSAASCHRDQPDIPLLMPEINPHLLAQGVAAQTEGEASTRGWIVAKPNCTVQPILLSLYPLHQAFILDRVAITTLQSTSGAGKQFSLSNNLIPYISHEEEKIESELSTLLEHPVPISVHCNRVPVEIGHLVCISASFQKMPTLQQVKECWHDFRAPYPLPSSPPQPLLYREEADRPQPLYDSQTGQGMVVTLGRLRTCSLFQIRFVALSHNLVRGAAGTGILSAELALAQELI